MDDIGGLLDGPRARDAFVLRILLDPPWSLRIQDEAPLTIMAVVRGDAWIGSDLDGEPARLVKPGEIAVMRGPEPYTLSDDPATAPQVIVHPGQRCMTLDGRDLAQAMELGVRTWAPGSRGRRCC